MVVEEEVVVEEVTEEAVVARSVVQLGVPLTGPLARGATLASMALS